MKETTRINVLGVGVSAINMTVALARIEALGSAVARPTTCA